jgi:hypothetical protein
VALVMGLIGVVIGGLVVATADVVWAPAMGSVAGSWR